MLQHRRIPIQVSQSATKLSASNEKKQANEACFTLLDPVPLTVPDRFNVYRTGFIFRRSGERVICIDRQQIGIDQIIPVISSANSGVYN
jgi:hypothetical protein